jgi:CRISPR-associated protein Cmr2
MTLIYTALTFAPVQGFIERSRKLRDLYGASNILSFLSKTIIDDISRVNPNAEVISPGAIDLKKGVPNRILLAGEYSATQLRETIDITWRNVLRECRQWIERELSDYPYTWERDWQLWGAHTWECFHGCGESITDAMNDLEDKKLARDWTGVNWIGESSSLSGTDAIAWYGMGAGSRNPKSLNPGEEKPKIDEFYQRLLTALETTKVGEAAQGKFLDENERLSIPELVKRMVTHHKIAKALGMAQVDRFSDIKRLPNPKANPPEPGEWSAWFMGDGDKVGDHLKHLVEKDKDKASQSITTFSEAMGKWGEDFEDNFKTTYKNLGRIIYAGGDDFLGVIYNTDTKTPLTPETTATLRKNALDWLGTLNQTWQEHQQPITLSVGFVWAGHSVPQRDVLQHCREAESQAKLGGRDRVALRVVFNNGQHVQWIAPWDWLPLLGQYRDRDGGDNWVHVYNDWAQLKARHAVEPNSQNPARHFDDEQIVAAAILARYFDRPDDFRHSDGTPPKRCDWQHLQQHMNNTQLKLLGDDPLVPEAALVDWVNNLIEVGWHLCRPHKPSVAVDRTLPKQAA